MKQKIGIVTFHCSYNYGSILQTYALQKYISKEFGDVKIINYVSKDFEQYRLFRYTYYKRPGYFFEDLRYLTKNYRRMRSFKSFSKNYLKLTSNIYYKLESMRELNDEFDAFICGSDQIWNPGCTFGLNPVYFLGFANPNKKRIAYAPSIACNYVSDEILQKFKNYLTYLDSISVREEKGRDILKLATDKTVSVVLDPTLLLDKEDYVELLSDNKNGEYIFVYMLEGIDKKMLEYAEMLSKNKNIPIIYISKNNLSIFSNSKNFYGISPNEFLNLLSNAKYIVTNSFHATVFSIIFEKNFCTFKTETSSSRMVDLLNKLNLNYRLYNELFDIDENINYFEVKENLNSYRRESIKYLEGNLDKKK
ncbi:TPA: polysaccharide pyruvyl transferase family protein [Clostridium perfringens]|nr:polysaccharide pyruvyl transferase family protein [Clostridium perfringens]